MSAPTILITNGGPHSAETWAETTVSQIMVVAPDSASAAIAEAFRARLMALLADEHADVQKRERAALKSYGVSETDYTERAREVCARVVLSARGSPFEPHFYNPATVEYLDRLLAEHFNTVASIERQWHSDRSAVN